ncbi:MAG: zinc ribbon domain-containing protein, partial [Desulfobacterales bacterium]|nr:zinc ribbon domain-containing protein [Desulfobacterales bacterium]
MVRTVTSSVERAVRLQVKFAYGRASIRRQKDKRRWQMFFKKKCPNCGAKNPEALKACAICGAPFALRQMKEQLEGRKGPTPAWPKEVEKEA